MNFPPYNIHTNYNNYSPLTLDDIRAIAINLGGARKCSSGYKCRCPAHNGCNSNLSISLGDNGKLLMYCLSRGCEFEDIVKTMQDKGLLPANGGLNNRQNRTTKIYASVASKDLKIDAAYVNKIWNECLSSKTSVVETYLKGRGYTGSISASLRYHPNLFHTDTQLHYPAMVAAVKRWPENDIVGIHRTYLKRDGSGKADIEYNKMMLGTTSGGAVRLVEVGQKLILAEGIETALSLYLATGLPTWATLSTSGMVNVLVPPLDVTQEIIIAADNDMPGRKAANKLADRLLKNGYRVSIIMPPEGMDFNDLLRGEICL